MTAAKRGVDNEWKTKYDESAANHHKYKTEVEVREILFGAGVLDRDAQSMLLHRYTMLPEEGRPKLSEWIGDEGDARKDKFVSHIWTGEQKIEDTGDDKKGEGDDKKKKTPPPVAIINGEKVVKFTPELITKLSPEQRKEHKDQIFRDLGYA